jgi:hypothetical protein
MLNYLLFDLFLNIFELFVTKNIVPNFRGNKFPAFALMREILLPAYVR